jgi:hypothetical protein
MFRCHYQAHYGWRQKPIRGGLPRTLPTGPEQVPRAWANRHFLALVHGSVRLTWSAVPGDAVPSAMGTVGRRRWRKESGAHQRAR